METQKTNNNLSGPKLGTEQKYLTGFKEIKGTHLYFRKATDASIEIIDSLQLKEINESKILDLQISNLDLKKKTFILTISPDGDIHKIKPVTLIKENLNSTCKVIIKEEVIYYPSVISIAIYMIVSGKDILNLIYGDIIFCTDIKNGNIYRLTKKLDQYIFGNQKIEDHWDCHIYDPNTVISEKYCLDPDYLPKRRRTNDRYKPEHKKIIREKLGDLLEGLNLWVY